MQISRIRKDGYTMNIGKTQTLTVIKRADFGLYLANDKENADMILLPNNQVPEGTDIGDTLTVFVYRDSRDRPIATLKTPAMTLGEVGICTVKEIGNIGAFLDWGLEKDLFLPFREMTYELTIGMQIPVALYLDKSNRLCATMKLYKYLQYATDVKKGDTVSGIVYEISDNFGAFVAIDDLYQGLIPKREMNSSIHAGDRITARVTAVKPDGKVDLSVREPAHIQMDIDADRLANMLKACGGSFPFDDKADPSVIRAKTDMSKNEFKRAVGRLLKNNMIELRNGKIILLQDKNR